MIDKKEIEALANRLCEGFFKRQSANLLTNVEKKNVEKLDVTRDRILSAIGEELKEYEDEDGNSLSDEEQTEVLEMVRKNLWGYGNIDDLIHRKDVSDIKLYGADNVRIKSYGKRDGCDDSFSDEGNYSRFITKILERNKVNLGTANAIQTFTDRTQDDFTLRITVISGLLTDTGLPVMAIRKIPKEKYTLRYLEDAGMFSSEANIREADDSKVEKSLEFFSEKNRDLNELIIRMVNSRGILFTGKGASGKSTLMNAMIAVIPWDESVMICQENVELFDENHPDLFSCHAMTNAGDSKVSYELGDLTRAALLVDLDRVIVGEVKEGSEAAGLSKASMTGHKCWTSVHGESCEMAVDKMADYISQATGYSTRESLKQLMGFEYVVHLKNFRVDEIKRIAG